MPNPSSANQSVREKEKNRKCYGVFPSGGSCIKLVYYSNCGGGSDAAATGEAAVAVLQEEHLMP